MNILTVLDKAKALELADFLDDLSVNGGNRDYKNEAICSHVGNMFSEYYATFRMWDWLKVAFILWPKFSGDIFYPVPCDNCDVREAFEIYNRWDKRTQYGKDRRELCTFLANLIRSQCDE